MLKRIKMFRNFYKLLKSENFQSTIIPHLVRNNGVRIMVKCSCESSLNFDSRLIKNYINRLVKFLISPQQGRSSTS
jgi:hypothetical protein